MKYNPTMRAFVDTSTPRDYLKVDARSILFPSSDRAPERPYDQVDHEARDRDHYYRYYRAQRQRGTYDVSGFDMHDVRVSVTASAHDGVDIRCECMVRGRDTGDNSPLTHRERVDARAWTDGSPGFRANVVRRVLLQMLAHELDECLLVEGERLFDPHKTERP